MGNKYHDSRSGSGGRAGHLMIRKFNPWLLQLMLVWMGGWDLLYKGLSAHISELIVEKVQSKNNFFLLYLQSHDPTKCRATMQPYLPQTLIILLIMLHSHMTLKTCAPLKKKVSNQKCLTTWYNSQMCILKQKIMGERGVSQI